MTDTHKTSPSASLPAVGAEADSQSHEAIARRAFELWRQQGEPEGRHVENWFEAERQTRAERLSRADEAAGPIGAAPTVPATKPASDRARRTRGSGAHR